MLAASLAALTLSGLLIATGPALAAPGELDPAFGSGGVLVDGPPGGFQAAALQPDGKIVIASQTDSADIEVRRYSTTGVLDPTFGSGGRVRSDFGRQDTPDKAVLQPDGKVLVAVYSTDLPYTPDSGEWIVARYTSAGVLDLTFGTGGRAPSPTTRIRAMTVQPDGRILLVGVGTFVARLNADGSEDWSFGGGYNFPVRVDVAMHAAGIAVLADGKIIVAGSRTDGGLLTPGGVAVRLTSTGELDPTYGKSGVASTPVGSFIRGTVVQADGKVLLAGTLDPRGFDRQFAVARLTAEGDADLSFGVGGVMLASVADEPYVLPTDLALAPDGSLFVGGGTSLEPGNIQRMFIAHVRAEGAVDPRFGSRGAFVSTVAGNTGPALGNLLVQGDGAPVAVGTAGGPSVGYALRLLPPQRGAPVLASGWNGWGQLGDGTRAERHGAVGVAGRTDVRAVAAGAYHSLSLQSDGSVWAWGWNGLGQLGDGTTVERTGAVRVGGLTNVVAITAGAYHSIAVKADGSVWAWGWNGLGQLGDGTTIDRPTPVRVAGLVGVRGVKVAGGAFHTLLLAADGTVRAWGWNGLGQLGDGTTIERQLPVPVPGLADTVSVAAGAYHSLALAADGTVRAWGWNALGQLGDGTTVERDRPVRVPGLPPVVALAEGAYFHALAVGADGSTWAWGWNVFGQVGDGTTVDRHSPVRWRSPGLRSRWPPAPTTAWR